MTILEILEMIKVKDPLHHKKISRSLKELDNTFTADADQFLIKYQMILNNISKNFEFSVDSYLKMIKDFRKETVYFIKNGRYSCKSQKEAFDKVYSNPEVMHYYMHGLLLSQVLWKHHFLMGKFFLDNLSRYSHSESYLEIGGGHGFFIDNAVNIMENCRNFDLVDISESSLEISRAFLDKNLSKVNIFEADIFDFEPKDKYDFISMGEVLEHVDNPRALLQRLGKLLSQDGILWITTPTNAPAIDHIYLFRNEDEIVNLIEDSGFKVDASASFYSEEGDRKHLEMNNVTLLYGAFLKLKTQ